MAIDLKTETPDTTLPSTGFLFGADSQAVASPSVYTTQAVATTLLGSTTLNGATITADAPVLNLTQTWNNAAATFTGFRFNVPTDVSGANSLLMDLQVSGTSRFSVRKDGSFGQQGASGFYFDRFGSSNLVGAMFSSGESFRIYNPSPINPSVVFSRGIAFASTGSVSSNFRDALLFASGTARFRFGDSDTGAVSATVTITIASPGVVTWSDHRLSTGTPVVFTTTGALPTGITSGLTYYVIAVDTNTFQIATTAANAYAGTAVNTSGTQSGTHTATRYAITQRLSVQSVTGVADRIGSDFLIQGSQGTGTGAGGSIVFQVAPAGSTGTAQNALGNAVEISSNLNLTLGNITNSPGYSSPFIRLVAGITGGALHIRNYENGGPGIWMGTQTNAYLFSDPGNARILIPGSYAFGWSQNSATAQSTPDVLLARDAANTLALRNGGTSVTPVPQTFRVYNWTDGTNGEFGVVKFSSNRFMIASETTGTGAARDLEFLRGGASHIVLQSGRTFFGQTASIGGSAQLTFSNGTNFDRGFVNSAGGGIAISNGSTGGQSLEFREMTAPAAPATNGVYIYAEDNGAGKTRLMALFASGVAQQIAIEP